MKTTGMFLLILAAVVFADDIVLKDGTVYQNVNVLRTDGKTVYLQSTVKEFTITVDRIQSITKRPFEPNTTSKTIAGSSTAQSLKVQYAYPNAKLWPFTVLSFALAWDMFVDAGDTQNMIDAYKSLGIKSEPLEDLERTKTRKTVIGSVAVIAGAINMIFVLDKVQVTANDGMIGLAYNW